MIRYGWIILITIFLSFSLKINKGHCSFKNLSVVKVSKSFLIGITEYKRENLYAVGSVDEGSYIAFVKNKLRKAERLSSKKDPKLAKTKKDELYIPIHLFSNKGGTLQIYPKRVYANYKHLLVKSGYVKNANDRISKIVVSLSKKYSMNTSYAYFRTKRHINFYSLTSKTRKIKNQSYIFSPNDELPYIARSQHGNENSYVDVFLCNDLKQAILFTNSDNNTCEFGRIVYSHIHNNTYMDFLGIRHRTVKNVGRNNTLKAVLPFITNASDEKKLLLDLVNKIKIDLRRRLSVRLSRVEKLWGDLTLDDVSTSIAKASLEFDVDPYLVISVIDTESSFKPRAKSGAGAIGFMQIIPLTGKWIGEKLNQYVDSKTLYNPGVNIRLGTWYLSYLLKKFNYNSKLVAAAYNFGPSRARRFRLPTETLNYQGKVLMKHKRLLLSLLSDFGSFLYSDIITVIPVTS